MTQHWRSLSKFAGRPVTDQRDANRVLRRWIAASGVAATAQISRGRWFAVWRDDARASSIADFIDEYLLDASDRTTHNTSRNVRTHLARFLDWCGERGLRRLPDITRREIELWMKSLPDSLAATSRRKHVESVRAALNRALDWELIGANPAARISLPPNRATFTRRALTDSEIRLIHTQWRTPIREWAMLGLWAGLRRSEATYLAWADVDLDTGQLAVTAKPDFGFSPKGTRYRDGQPDVIPLVPWLAHALAQLPQGHRFVFDRGDDHPLRSPDRWWRHVRHEAARTGLPDDVTPHTFKHTFATRLALAGVNRAVLPKLTRHLSATMTDRYVHAALEDARREIAKLRPIPNEIPNKRAPK